MEVNDFRDKCNVSNFLCETTLEFQGALKSSVKTVLNRVTDEKFIEIYKNCYKGFQKRDDVQMPSLVGSSAEARKYRKQFNDIVMKRISETIDDTLKTTIDSNLKELEELKEEQADTSFTWRPPGDAVKHMIPFDSVSKVEEKRQLEAHLREEREAINLLKSRLIQKRLRAKELYSIVESSIKNIEKAVSATECYSASVSKTDV